jgi:hypothetical protein
MLFQSFQFIISLSKIWNSLNALLTEKNLTGLYLEPFYFADEKSNF